MKILKKEIIGEFQGARIIKMVILAPDIARKVRPGQFVVLMVSDKGERFPLTVVDRQEESITIIFQVLGLSTGILAKLQVGDSLFALAGPFGHPTEIKQYGNIIIVGGGVGIAEIYPVARAFKEGSNELITILGARNKDLLILRDELKVISNEFYLVSDDGSIGEKGFVTDVLERVLDDIPYDLCYAVGPIPMMRRVSEITLAHKVKTVVSLNALMVDATGMCGSCRVSIGGVTKFSCIDGPEFDAHQVNWDELIKRNQIYREQEKHICKLTGK